MLKQVEFLPRIRINVLQTPIPLSKIYDFPAVCSFKNVYSCYLLIATNITRMRHLQQESSAES